MTSCQLVFDSRTYYSPKGQALKAPEDATTLIVGSYRFEWGINVVLEGRSGVQKSAVIQRE